MAVPSTNVKLKADIGDGACKVVQTTNISLGSLMSGTTVGGILHTYAGQTSGPCIDFEKFGGTNNELETTPNTALTATDRAAIGNTPHKMNHAIGGFHEAGGGPGQ